MGAARTTPGTAAARRDEIAGAVVGRRRELDPVLAAVSAGRDIHDTRRRRIRLASAADTVRRPATTGTWRRR